MERGLCLLEPSGRESRKVLHQSRNLSRRRWGGHPRGAGACWGLPVAGGTPPLLQKLKALVAQWNKAAHFLQPSLLFKPWVFQHQQARSRNARETEPAALYFCWFCRFLLLGTVTFMCLTNPSSLTHSELPLAAWKGGCNHFIFFHTFRAGSEPRPGRIHCKNPQGFLVILEIFAENNAAGREEGWEKTCSAAEEGELQASGVIRVCVCYPDFLRKYSVFDGGAASPQSTSGAHPSTASLQRV